MTIIPITREAEIKGPHCGYWGKTPEGAVELTRLRHGGPVQDTVYIMGRFTFVKVPQVVTETWNEVTA